MKNLFAALFLGFATQQAIGTLFDYQLLSKYGEKSWFPYELNPLLGGSIALIALIIGLLMLERQPSFSRPTAIACAIFASVVFWRIRSPHVNSYRDYGEENFAIMALNLLLIGGVMFIICGIEYIYRMSRIED